MKKRFTLILASMLLTMGAWAQQTLSNGVYTIDNVYDGRGSMCYGTWNGTESFGLTGITRTDCTGNNLTVADADVANKYWYVKTTEHGVYIYNIGKGVFLQRYASEKVTCEEDVANGFTFEARTANETSYTSVKYNDYYLSYSCGWAPNSTHGSVRWLTSNEAAATLFTFNQIADAETTYATQIAAADAAIEEFERVPADADYIAAAKSNIVEGIGYPKTTSNAYIALNELTIEAGKTEIEIDAIVDAYLTCTDVVFPEDGKAYTIKAKYNGGTFRYIYDNGTKIQMTETKPADLSATFVLRKLDENGNYALVNNRGKYMVFYASEKTGAGNTANGLADTYELGEQDAVVKFVPAGNLTPTNGGLGDDNLCGCFALQAYMNGSGMHYLMAGAPDFHNGERTVLYYSGGNRSSYFIFEEAEYANTPELKSVGTSKLLSEDLHNKALATFSAPFATVVPEGVTAYTATAYEGGVSLAAIEGAIPANTGVVLVGETAGTVTMKPVTSETVAEVTENAFEHSAGAAIVDFNAGYVLSAVNGVAGFYKANSGTLAMNKAYLAVASEAQAIRVTRGSDEETTSIDNAQLTMDNENVVIYDLQGRRVQQMEKGIYIVNGRKVIR